MLSFVHVAAKTLWRISVLNNSKINGIKMRIARREKKVKRKKSLSFNCCVARDVLSVSMLDILFSTIWLMKIFIAKNAVPILDTASKVRLT